MSSLEAAISDDPEQNLGYVMGRAFMRLRSGLLRAFRASGHDITPEQWSVIKTLTLRDGLTQCGLGERTVRDKTAITRILDRLEAKGYLERRRDGSDRRRHQVYLTPAGRELHDHLVPVVHAYRDTVFQDLAPVEIATLRGCLDKITSRIS